MSLEFLMCVHVDKDGFGFQLFLINCVLTTDFGFLIGIESISSAVFLQSSAVFLMSNTMLRAVSDAQGQHKANRNGVR